MAVERALVTPKNAGVSPDYYRLPIPVLESERSLIEKSVGIDLTTIILSHLTLASLTDVTRNPNKLLPNVPSYTRLQTLNKLKGPEDEVKLFTELFASTLTKSWTATDTNNISQKEKRLTIYCTELSNKNYDLKRVMQEVCKHFNLSLTEALEIAKKEYFTIDDLALELEMNIRYAQIKVKETLKKNPTIKRERFGGKGGRLFIPESQRNKLKSIVGSLIQTAIVTLPDNTTAIIKGGLKKRIFDMFLPTFNQPHGLALDKIIDLYPKGDPNAKGNSNHVIAALKKELQAFGWTIENKYIRKGPWRKGISEYFLKKIEVPIAEAPVITPLGIKGETETTIFDADNTRFGKSEPTSYPELGSPKDLGRF